MNDLRPKCGAKPVNCEREWWCGSRMLPYGGVFSQGKRCRIKELEADNTKLRAIVEAIAGRPCLRDLDSQYHDADCIICQAHAVLGGT